MTIGPKSPTRVWIGGLLSASEAGDSPRTVTKGMFYLRRTGDLSQPLTVGVSFDSSGDYATEGADFTAPDSVTFPADDPANGIDGSTAYLTATPKKDNLIEDDELIHAVLQPGSGYRVLSYAREADLLLVDDPPQAWATAEWASPSEWPQIGQITISRSGGDLTQPLTTWVEVEGEAFDDIDGYIPLVLAFTYTLPADLTSVLVCMQADDDGRPDVPGGGIISREDRTQGLKNVLAGGAGDPGDALTRALTTLSLPLTRMELAYLKSVADGTAPELAGMTPFELGSVATAAGNYLAGAYTVDWSTLIGPALAVGGPGVWGMIYEGGVWPKFRKRVDDLIPQLGAQQWADREAASQALSGLFNSAMNKTDLMSAAYVAWKLKETSESAQDPEVKARAKILFDWCINAVILLYFPNKKMPNN